MKICFLCTYYSQWAHENLAPRSQAQWHAYKFCRAVKYKTINGTLEFPWKAGPETINTETVGRARYIFGFFIKRALKTLVLAAPVLVPIPSKDALPDATTFRSLDMVREAIASHGNWTIAPVLRFTKAIPPASEGGPRGREVLRPHLTVIARPPAGSIVLVDDIITTGGSLLASFDVLEAYGRPPVAAIVCGQTVADSLLTAFGDHEREIDHKPSAIDF
jgi:hypothetical protein